MFSYVSLEERIPADHPLRAMRALVDETLKGLSRRFSGRYAETRRPSIPPERLLRALLHVLCWIRSERLLDGEVAMRTEAHGHAERLAAQEMVEEVAGRGRITLGADVERCRGSRRRRGCFAG